MIINTKLLSKRNLFLLIVIFYSVPSISQLRFDYPIKILEPVELIATYSLKFQQDSSDQYFIKQEDMLLFLGQNSSKFISNDFFIFDTIMRQISSNAKLDELLSNKSRPLPMSRFLFQIFKNHPKGKLTCLDHVIGDSFKYEESLDLFNWQLTEDTVTIAGYKTQKATTNFGGRSWIAWFSPELPFNDGPYKFNGLPGLIVKIFDSNKHYEFELLSIKKPYQKLMVDYRKKDFLIVSKQEFFSAEDAFREDIIYRAKAANLPLDVQIRAAKKMSERNNPIELKRK